MLWTRTSPPLSLSPEGFPDFVCVPHVAEGCIPEDVHLENVRGGGKKRKIEKIEKKKEKLNRLKKKKKIDYILYV